MADEIRINLRMTAAKNGVDVRVFEQERVDMSGTHSAAATQDLTTSEAAIDKGSISVMGYIAFKALESNTDYISLGVKPSGTFIECCRLWHGQVALWRVGANEPWGKSASGTQKVQCSALES